MTNRELMAIYHEDAIVFTEDWYDAAIMGVTIEGNVIYDYDKLVQILMEHDKMDYVEAVEWVDYNMVRGAQYMGQARPFIAYTTESIRSSVI